MISKFLTYDLIKFRFEWQEYKIRKRESQGQEKYRAFPYILSNKK